LDYAFTSVKYATIGYYVRKFELDILKTLACSKLFN